MTRTARTVVAGSVALGMLFAGSAATSGAGHTTPGPSTAAAAYDDLVRLLEEFRAFAGQDAPADLADYGAAMAGRIDALSGYQDRLAAMDVSDWPIAEQVDYHLVRGEMNGLEFQLRVMRPWERHPGFYSLGRAGLGRLPELPLSAAAQGELQAALRALPGHFETARANLGDGDLARIPGDFALMAVRNMGPEVAALERFLERAVTDHPDLVADARAAMAATVSYLDWLRDNRAAMTAPAGVGRDNYDWLLKNVYLFPYTWEECLQIVHLEDNRVITFLRLEQNRNRDLPPLDPVTSQEEYRASVLDTLDYIDRFIRDQEIYTVPDYLVDDAYRRERIEATSGPWPEQHPYFKAFAYREPLMEETHELVGHHYDLLRQQHGTHPIRDAREHEGPYFQSVARWEGLAFAYEELLMHAGYLDERSPRGRELVYEQAAFRTLRALSDLYMHAHEWSLEEAMEYSIANAPYPERLRNSNQLWAELGDTTLNMVGWHAQMVVGKVQFMKLLRDRSQQLGDAFVLREFMDEFYALSALPTALLRWEMTGLDDEMKRLLE